MPGHPGGGYFPGSPDQWAATRESDLSHDPLDPVNEKSRGDRFLAELIAGDGGDRLRITARQVTVGSGSGADVVLTGIPGGDFGLRLEEGIWRVQNPAGAGIEVDGQQVGAEAVLAPGSEITIGGRSLFFAPADRWEDSRSGSPTEEPAAAGPPATRSHPGYVLDVPDSSRGVPAAVIVVAGLALIVMVVFLLLGSG